MNAKTRQAMQDLPAAQQAGILCNDPAFQRYAATRSGFAGGQFQASAAAEFLRDECDVDSRRDLDRDPDARARFDRLKTSFDAWRGRIAAPRD